MKMTRLCIGIIAWALICGVQITQAASAPKPFVMDLPTSPETVLPWWLEVSDGGMESMFGTRSFGLTPPEGDWDLAVTVYYDETPGGSLRIYWSSPERTEILTDNLYEGSCLPNQRTILIRRAMLSQPGRLTFQSATSLMNPWRIRWEWLKPTTVWTSSAKTDEWALVEDSGQVLTTKEISGDELAHPSDNWKRRVITAYLSERVERFENSIEFVTQIESIGEVCCLSASLAGVPMDRQLEIWLNGEWAGQLALETPDLSNTAYRAGVEGQTIFSGWRKGTIFIPSKLLQTGENRFQIGFDSTEETAVAQPLAIKNVALQIKYSEPSASANSKNNTTTALQPNDWKNP